MLSRAPAQANAVDRLADSVLSAGSGLYARFAVRIGVIGFSLYILLTALSAVILPDANWDILPYLAVAEESAYPTPQALHDYAYGTVKAAVSEADYRALTDDGGGYRTRMANDAAAFHSMLPMYRVKFLYAEVLSGLSQVMPPVMAMRAVQVFSVLLFGGIILLWLRSAGALAFAPVIAAVLIVAEFADAARSSTPDILCSALLLGGLYAHVRQRQATTAILLLLAVLVRPDNVIFVGVFAVLLLAFRQWSPGALAATVASSIAYFAISRWAGHPGWWPHLYFSSIAQQMNMDGFDPAFSVALYAKAFANAVMRSIIFNSWVGVAVLALAGWYVSDRAGFRLDRRAGILFAALVLAVLAKFVVFPIHDGRIYFPNLVAPFLLLAGPLTAMWRSMATTGIAQRMRVQRGYEMSSVSDLARIAVSLGLPTGILDRGPALRGTRFLARAAMKARFRGGRPFQMVNVGACDGALFDDVTPWLNRIPRSRAVLVEPIPYNQHRLRANYPDKQRFVIEPVAVTRRKGTITVKTFDAAALEAGTLPIEFIGCSSITDTNLMSGKNAWGEADENFNKFAPHLRDIEVPSDTLQSILDRNKIEHIDAFLVDCEGADWIVFEQLDIERYRPGFIKVEVGALPAAEIGEVLVKLKTAGYQVGLYAEDVWAFA